MRYRLTAVCAAGLAALALGVPRAGAADDTLRLGGGLDATTSTLAFDGTVDTTLTRGVRGSVGHVGFRGAGVGYRGGFRGGFYGGNRGWYGGYRGWYGGNRGWYGGYGGYGGWYGGYGGYGGWYGGYGYYPYWYGNYWYPPVYLTVAPSYYAAPPVYYAANYSYYPVSQGYLAGSAGLTLRPSIQVAPSQSQLPYPNVVPGTPMPGPGGSYNYDGGPANPVPLPGNTTEPPAFKAPTPQIVPSDGKFVSYPAASTTSTKSSIFAYPAYGETTTPSAFASDRSPVLVTGTGRR
jgi:hypothetical protein